MDEVSANNKPLLIKRQNGKHIVLMSLSEFNSIEETHYLMSNPKNAARLNRSIQSLEQGKGILVDMEFFESQQ